MCVTFVYLNSNAVGDASGYQLIVLNNRDESLDRPTSFAAWEGSILAGRDEAIPTERGGTWLGIRKDGKLGVLLSMLQKSSTLIPGSPTRGKIVNGYLGSQQSAEEYGRFMAACAHTYNGFNLLLFDRIRQSDGLKTYELVNLGNMQGNSQPETLGSGIYGFGNSPRLSPFKKVEYGTQLFRKNTQQMEGKTCDELLQEFLQILKDDTSHHPDDQLMSQTEQHEDCSKAMSQLFYRYPHPHRYGTRSHTIIMIDGLGQATYFERSLLQPPEDIAQGQWADTKFVFNIDG